MPAHRSTNQRAIGLIHVRVSLILAALAAGLCLFAGCAENHVAISPTSRPAERALTEPQSARPERDPIAYLREVQSRCAQLAQYTLVFTRQERRGFLQQLTAPERIACWFRRSPFSVRMKWLDPDVKYGESVYVNGQHDNKVRFVPRKGLFGGPPGINEIDLMTPVVWGEAKRPLTDFGLESMLNRTLETYDGFPGDGTAEFVGTTTLLDPPRRVYEVRITYRTARPATPVQELYIDAETDLPVCILIKRPDGSLDAAYIYEELDGSVKLTDADFQLEYERARASASATN